MGTIGELKAAYVAYLNDYCHAKSDMPERIGHALKLLDCDDELDVELFGTAKLVEAREKILKRKQYSVKYINEQIQFIRRMFEWAAEREIVGSDVPYALTLVKPVPSHRKGVKPAQERQPVPMPDVRALLPYLHPTLQAMVAVQLYSAMRPGELVKMRPVDLDMSERIWFYTPGKLEDEAYSHKTEWKGQSERQIVLCKHAQDVIAPRLIDRKPGDFMFRPSDDRSWKPDNKRNDGDHYTSVSYRRALTRAIQRLNRDRETAAIESREKYIPMPAWTPYQLRHTMATDLRAQFGDDGVSVTQVMLGHKRIDTTQIYAKVNT